MEEKMQVTVNINDAIWKEYSKYDRKNEKIQYITEEALKGHLRKMKAYKNLLKLKGKVKWEGNVDELRRMRV
jgi:hypothetical protein